jgi:hypothetical protein
MFPHDEEIGARTTDEATRVTSAGVIVPLQRNYKDDTYHRISGIHLTCMEVIRNPYPY